MYICSYIYLLFTSTFGFYSYPKDGRENVLYASMFRLRLRLTQAAIEELTMPQWGADAGDAGSERDRC